MQKQQQHSGPRSSEAAATTGFIGNVKQPPPLRSIPPFVSRSMVVTSSTHPPSSAQMAAASAPIEMELEYSPEMLRQELRRAAKDTRKRMEKEKVRLQSIPLHVKERMLEEAFPSIGAADTGTDTGTDTGGGDGRNCGKKKKASSSYRVPTLSKSEIETLRRSLESAERKKNVAVMKSLWGQMKTYHELLESHGRLRSEYQNMKSACESMALGCVDKDARIAELERQVVEMKLSLAQVKSGEDHHRLATSKMEAKLVRVSEENKALHELVVDHHMNISSVGAGASAGLEFAPTKLKKQASFARAKVKAGQRHSSLVLTKTEMKKLTQSMSQTEMKKLTQSLSQAEGSNNVRHGSEGALFLRTTNWMKNSWHGTGSASRARLDSVSSDDDHMYGVFSVGDDDQQQQQDPRRRPRVRRNRKQTAPIYSDDWVAGEDSEDEILAQAAEDALVASPTKHQKTDLSYPLSPLSTTIRHTLPKQLRSTSLLIPNSNRNSLFVDSLFPQPQAPIPYAGDVIGHAGYNTTAAAAATGTGTYSAQDDYGNDRGQPQQQAPTLNDALLYAASDREDATMRMSSCAGSDSAITFESAPLEFKKSMQDRRAAASVVAGAAREGKGTPDWFC